MIKKSIWIILVVILGVLIYFWGGRPTMGEITVKEVETKKTVNKEKEFENKLMKFKYSAKYIF